MISGIFIVSLSWWRFSGSYWRQFPVSVFIKVNEDRSDEFDESSADDCEAESEICSESLAFEVTFRFNFG